MSKEHKKIFAGCFYAYFVCGMFTLMLGAIMPMILTEYNLGYDKGGMLLSFHSAGNLIASFLSGIVSIYFGRKNSIVILSSMAVLGFVGMLLTQSPAILMVMFLMTGISRGSIGNMNNSIVNDLSDGKPGALNILHTFFAVGAFMAPFLAAWYVVKGLGWKYAIATVVLLSIAMVIVFALMKLEDKKNSEKDKGEKGKGSFDFLKHPDYYIAGGILFFYVGVESAVNGWLVTYLKDTGIMSTSLAQTLLSILWITIIFGRLFCAYISKTVDKRTILLGSSIGSMLFFTIFIISTNIWVIVGCMIGLGFCLAGVFPTTVANVGNLIKGSGLGMGILLAISGLGGIVAPYIIGAVAEKSGIAGGMATITGSVVLMFLFTLVNRLRKPKEKVSLEFQ